MGALSSRRGRLRTFEDFSAGETFDLGEIVVTREAIERFAREFDPLPARGALASGPHTFCLGLRVIADRLLRHCSVVGSPGVSELRWRELVRAGDRLRVRLGVVVTARHRQALGLVRFRCRLENQRADEVLTAELDYLLLCRPAS